MISVTSDLSRESGDTSQVRLTLPIPNSDAKNLSVCVCVCSWVIKLEKGGS